MAKTYLWVIVIITVIGIIAFYQYSNLDNKEPKIEVTPAFYDFGDIPYELVEHTFFVKNIGEDILEITRISTSCGCTKGTIDKELIEPGETANLLVTIDPNLMEEDIEGKIERIVYIKS
ncbi:MAG: DUF1573 domain-containing protein, partial [Nanoarchaeota archaeon]|nr:DUF1573 domain-containing protein [Nanoarchaeota archaeon]